MIIINLGLVVWGKEKPIGIITILIGFVLFYFLFYSIQIKTNEEKTKDNEKKINNLEDWSKNTEKILNTLRDITTLQKVDKIK